MVFFYENQQMNPFEAGGKLSADIKNTKNQQTNQTTAIMKQQKSYAWLLNGAWIMFMSIGAIAAFAELRADQSYDCIGQNYKCTPVLPPSHCAVNARVDGACGTASYCPL